ALAVRQQVLKNLRKVANGRTGNQKCARATAENPFVRFQRKTETQRQGQTRITFDNVRVVQNFDLFPVECRDGAHLKDEQFALLIERELDIGGRAQQGFSGQSP